MTSVSSRQRPHTSAGPPVEQVPGSIRDGVSGPSLEIFARRRLINRLLVDERLRARVLHKGYRRCHVAGLTGGHPDRVGGSLDRKTLITGDLVLLGAVSPTVSCSTRHSTLRTHTWPCSERGCSYGPASRVRTLSGHRRQAQGRRSPDAIGGYRASDARRRRRTRVLSDRIAAHIEHPDNHAQREFDRVLVGRQQHPERDLELIVA